MTALVKSGSRFVSRTRSNTKAMSTAPLNSTRNALPTKTRKTSIALLNQVLADFSDLASQFRNAHWNVRGPQFYPLHELFERLAGQVEEPIDGIAERATALGGIVGGSLREAAELTRLPKFPESAQGLDLVQALAQTVSVAANHVRAEIDIADDAGDAGTADLLTELSQNLDKALWLLEAHGPAASGKG